MFRLVGAEDLRSKKVQRVLGDVYLHGKYWNYLEHVDLVFADEGRWRFPRHIEEVHLFRPEHGLLWDEALRVTYDNGSFFLESVRYALKERVAGTHDPHPLAVSKVLDKSLEIWRRRWRSENGLEGDY